MNMYSALLTSAVCLCSGSGWAAPNKLLYDLQERCGNRVAADFKRDYDTGIQHPEKGAVTLSTFKNHYNSKLNACLYWLRQTGYTTDEKTKVQNSFLLRFLSSVNENSELANYSELNGGLFHCDALGKACHSEAEFDSLIKPLMEE